MEVAVCVPYRRDDGDREANFAFTKARWEQFGFPVFHADSDGEPFSRAQAINRAVAQTDADVILICDSDIFLEDPEQAWQACHIAEMSQCYVVAFSHLRVFDWEETRAVRAGADPSKLKVLEKVSMIWGGCFALPRALFDSVKGLDERFVGYGCEDIAFLTAATTMGNPGQRVNGIAYHIRHAAGIGGATYENNLLYGRYKAVDGDKEGIMALVNER